MRILAIDPGGTTGFVYYDENPLVHGQRDDWKAFCEMVEEWLDQSLIDQIVIESYQITSETIRKTRQYEPLMIIGTVYFLAGKYNVPVKLQGRQIKAFATDTKLKNMGWWFPGQQHARDAARHLLGYLVDTEQVDPGKYLGWCGCGETGYMTGECGHGDS